MRSREEVLKEIEETGYELAPEDKGFVMGLVRGTNWSLAHVLPVVDAVRRGVTVQEWTTLSPRQLDVIESTAIELYRKKDFDQAFVIYAGLRQYAEPQSKSFARALRGMASCNHSQGYLLDALDQYRIALEIDPTDLLCRVSLAEVLCYTGQPAKGVAMARDVVAKKNKGADPKLMRKAQALIESRGGSPMLDFLSRRESSTLDLRKRATGQVAADLAKNLLDALSRQAH